jgi:multimeric flavodoxin WrbA
MKILIISSSPNHDGLTAKCTAAAVEGIQSSGETYVEIRINDLNIRHCEACGNGWGTCLNEHFGQEEDDFQALHARFLEMDGYIIITPVYYGEMSESLKAFTDRLRRCEATRRSESGLNGKPVIAVAAAGGSGNGMITCLFSMERWIDHVQARKFVFIPINRWNREVMIDTIRLSAQAMVKLIRDSAK